MKEAIGIDVSKEWFDYAYDLFGITKVNRVCNTVVDIHQFIKKNHFYPELHRFVMEATGSYHYKLASILSDLGFDTFVVNPLCIKRYSESKLIRVKTDKADAKTILNYAQKHDNLRTFIKKSDAQLKIEKLLKAYIAINNDITRNRNRIEGLSQYNDVVSEVVEEYENINCFLKERLKAIKKDIMRIIIENYKDEYERLTSIPGIGPINAATIIGCYGDFSNFETSKQVVAYAGLNPSPNESGKILNRNSSMSKQGMNYVRRNLFMGARTACRLNKQCTALSERHKGKKKPWKYIQAAVAQKILRQAFGVVKKNEMYQENYKKRAIVA